MYFASRAQAGRMLAAQLKPDYRSKPCAILALDDGGAMIGIQIASELHCVMTLLLSSEINLPRESEAIAGINTFGSMTYNPSYEAGDLEEMKSEYFGLIEQQKIAGMHALNKLIGKGGQVSRRLIEDHNIIIVSDGLQSGFKLDLAIAYLKPIKTLKLIVATPLASIPAIDRMHVLADELHCLSPQENYLTTDHYYEKQDVPDHDDVVKTVERLTTNWQ